MTRLMFPDEKMKNVSYHLDQRILRMLTSTARLRGRLAHQRRDLSEELVRVAVSLILRWLDNVRESRKSSDQPLCFNWLSIF